MKKILTLFILVILVFSCSKKEDKEIVFNLYSSPRTLDPQKFNDTLSLQISNSLYEGLLRLDDKNEIVGGMAQSYEKKDNKYIFKLREDLKYSDGSPITLEDVKNGFLRLLNKENTSQYAGMLFVVKNAKNYYEGKVSENELGIYVENDSLVIELDKDVAYFPYLLTLPLSVPYKEGKYNGPFKLVLQKEQEILLEKNENYWRSKEVELNRFKYVYFKDYSVINNLIKNEDIDISRVDRDLISNGLNINTNFDGRIWYLDFNLVNNSNLENIHLRKALSLAIDREEYTNIVKNDGSKKALNLIDGEILNYTPKYFIEDYNKEEALKELELAKEELNVSEFDLELLSGNTPIEIKEIQYIQEKIRTVLGIEAKIKTVPYKDRLSLIKENKYDIALNTWSPKYRDGSAILDRFTFKNKDIKVFDKTSYQNLLEEAKGNIDNRNELLNNLEEMLLSNYIVVPLYFSVENQYTSSSIKKVSYHNIGNITDMSYLKFK